MGDPRKEWFVIALRSGNRAAFSRLVGMVYPRLFATALRRGFSEEAAVDVSNSVFARILKDPTSLPPDQGLNGIERYLFGTLKNVLRETRRDQLRERDRAMSALEDAEERQGIAPPEIAERREMRSLVLQGLELLSPTTMRAVLLKYWSGLSCQQISELQGRSENAVCVDLSRARAALRSVFKRLSPDSNYQPPSDPASRRRLAQ